MESNKPLILAPAGDKNAFYAALSAGADAVYAGLKHFSARMQADNFSISDLARLKEMAAKRDAKLFVALNTLLKPGDPKAAGRLLDRLTRTVQPDALIIQDPGFIELARQTGFQGELHLSTLANVTHPSALQTAAEIGASTVVLPRELNIEEIKGMAKACPDGLSLELFIHGALCYAVSGRCYWSSYYGGKSGLRGRCVQPCRRRYTQAKTSRLFSCRDLGLDLLVRTLLDTPQIRTWKIEGRKKGPHYVYYTTTAYKLLRDEGGSRASKKQAEDLLQRALGRPTTHYHFLPQRQNSAPAPNEQTASGLFAGKTSAPVKGQYSIKPWFPLLKGDLLRVGYEDDPWHAVVPVRKNVPKGGRFDVQSPKGKTPRAGSSVFLIDRRERELVSILKKMDAEFNSLRGPESRESDFAPQTPQSSKQNGKPEIVTVRRGLFSRPRKGMSSGIWLKPKGKRPTAKSAVSNLWWWLPPVIWPDEEIHWKREVHAVLKNGAKRFVLGAPWQLSLFPESVNPASLFLWAGPFCNISNVLALQVLKQMGFNGTIVSPELNREEYLALGKASPLPLGIVTKGFWPLCISRTAAPELKYGTTFESPRKEPAFAWKFDQNTWLFPGIPLDLTEHQNELSKAGYSQFINMDVRLPKGFPHPDRSSKFNWNGTLL